MAPIAKIIRIFALLVLNALGFVLGCPYGQFKDDISFSCMPCSMCVEEDHLYPRCKADCDKVTTSTPPQTKPSKVSDVTQATSSAIQTVSRILSTTSRMPYTPFTLQSTTRSVIPGPKDQMGKWGIAIFAVAIVLAVVGCIGFTLWCCFRGRDANRRQRCCRVFGSQNPTTTPVACTEYSPEADETMV
ncbi:uncharacterized protein LOC116616624 isoform X2 [Nematostella vectensis]|uniref:uncharacterized protein LOC116616624 isoform X2 n=1 Tax=Nematostella vectensis TaxID=45351 RepID=UPI002077947B|nr:uncharacterized protein LOC116616624 isoform X2 [Nematostella vectensis]